MSSAHHVYPRFLCRLAVTDRCAGAPAPSRAGLGRWREGAAAVVATLLAIVAIGCADGTGSAADSALRLEGSASSMDLLGQSILEAMTTGDTVTLNGFRLTEHQHNDVVWPELPASAPEVNFPVDFAWQNITARNTRAFRRTLPVFAGRDLRFRRVECRGETETFETFEVMTSCFVVFERRDDRRPYEAQLFKDVLSRGGGYKIFRYYDEDPEPYAGT